MLNAIGIALIPTFLAVESQLAQYLAGITQAIVVVLLVLWPVLHLRSREEQKAAVPTSSLRPAIGGFGVSLPVPRRFL